MILSKAELIGYDTPIARIQVIRPISSPSMITIGEAAPHFDLPGVKSDREGRWTFGTMRSRWTVLFFYPADFTFVCPTEVLGFHTHLGQFTRLEAEILGVSVDSVSSHVAWARELGGVDYPLLSDEDQAISRRYGVFDEPSGVARRVTFIIDPQGLVQYIVASHHNVGRSVEETLRVLEALQTGRLCPSDWHPGDATFDLELKY